jgi:hypothetical protein
MWARALEAVQRLMNTQMPLAGSVSPNAAYLLPGEAKPESKRWPLPRPSNHPAAQIICGIRRDAPSSQPLDGLFSPHKYATRGFDYVVRAEARTHLGLFCAYIVTLTCKRETRHKILASYLLSLW